MCKAKRNLCNALLQSFVLTAKAFWCVKKETLQLFHVFKKQIIFNDQQVFIFLIGLHENDNACIYNKDSIISAPPDEGATLLDSVSSC